MWIVQPFKEKMMRTITRAVMAVALADTLMAPLPLAAQDTPNPPAELTGFWLTTPYPEFAGRDGVDRTHAAQ
jgi:hypothetical protein